MATYKQLGLSKSAIGRILSASRKPEFHQLATPEGLRDWLAAGNDLSDAVAGIGDVTEKAILEAMANLPPAGSVTESTTESTTEAGSEDEPLETEEPFDDIPSPTEVDEVVLVDVSLRIPFARVDGGYRAKLAASGRINLGKSRKCQTRMTPDEAMCSVQINEGLLRTDRRLSNGKPVGSDADVFRWLLGEILEKATQETHGT